MLGSDLTVMVDQVAQGGHQLRSVLRFGLPRLVVLCVLPAAVELVYFLLVLRLYLCEREQTRVNTLFTEKKTTILERKSLIL